MRVSNEKLHDTYGLSQLVVRRQGQIVGNDVILSENLMLQGMSGLMSRGVSEREGSGAARKPPANGYSLQLEAATPPPASTTAPRLDGSRRHASSERKWDTMGHNYQSLRSMAVSPGKRTASRTEGLAHAS